MYEHNDKVAQQMVAELLIQLKTAKTENNELKLREIAKLICGCSFGGGYNFKSIYERTLDTLYGVQNYWLNEEFPYGVELGIVNSVELEFIGY